MISGSNPPTPVRPPRWHHRLLLPLAGLTVGLLLSLLPQPALALCGLNTCGGSSEVSAVTVIHAYPDGEEVLPVEPQSGETIDLFLTWDVQNIGGVCGCNQTATAGATVRVDWSDGTKMWTATCTSGCNAMSGPIYGVTVCTHDGCGNTGIDHSWAYELVVQASKTNGTCTGNQGLLSRVTYTTSSVDDGDIIDTGGCEHDATVTPTNSEVFTVTDFGLFECTYSCAAATGPTLTIEYE